MNKTIQELVPLIQEWAKERGIFKKSTPFDQLLKTHEEVGELIKACYDNDKPAIQDAIGDVMVTLINYCYFMKIDAWIQINDVLNIGDETNEDKVILSLYTLRELSSLMNNTFITMGRMYEEQPKTIFFNFSYIIYYLNNIAFLEDTTLEACLNIAYNEIKNRTGKMINGKFIKNEK